MQHSQPPCYNSDECHPQDLPGTFPNHSWMQSDDGKAAVKRVLSAYSMHNDKLGYCRAMSPIVGLLLTIMNR